MKLNRTAAVAAIALAAQGVWAADITVTPVITTNDTTADGYGFTDASDVVIDDAGNVATIGDIYDANDGYTGVTFTAADGSGTTVVASSNTAIAGTNGQPFTQFQDLSLTNGTAAFTAPFVQMGKLSSDDQLRAGLFSSTSGTAATPVFYSDVSHDTANANPNSNPTSQTLNTAGPFTSLVYGVSATGQTSFGTLSTTGQMLNTNRGLTTLDTHGLQNFNATSNSPAYPVKTVALDDGSVVAIAQNSLGTSGVYDLTPTASTMPLTPRYLTITVSSVNYAPTQLLGATGSQSIVVAANTAANATDGQVFYQNGTSFIPLTSGIATVAPASTSTQIFGEMTPLGKAAVYVPSAGLIYHDTNQNSTQTLVAGTSQVSDSDGPRTIAAFGYDGDGATPMINENGWIVTGVELDGLQEALIGWNPKLDSSEILAKVGDTFQLSSTGPEYMIDDFTDDERNPDVDILKDELNEVNQVAFEVDYENVNDSTDTGTAVLTTTLSAVPEPATLGLISLGGIALLRRRRGTPS